MLTKFLQIDMDGIKRERSQQLESVLATNVRQREQEVAETQETLERQEGRLAEVGGRLSQLNGQLHRYKAGFAEKRHAIEVKIGEMKKRQQQREDEFSAQIISLDDKRDEYREKQSTL